MLEKVNHAALVFYAKAQAKAYSAVERLKERAKEDRGAEAIEWIAMLLVMGFVVSIIGAWMKEQGDNKIGDVFTKVFGFFTAVINMFKIK